MWNEMKLEPKGGELNTTERTGHEKKNFIKIHNAEPNRLMSPFWLSNVSPLWRVLQLCITLFFSPTHEKRASLHPVTS